MLAEINQILAPHPWQQKQWQELQARKTRGQLPHALMLRGSPGTGKAHFALALAQAMLCDEPVAQVACGRCKSCLLLKAGSHPDILLMGPEEDSKVIKIDQVRAVVNFVSRTAQYGGYRVAVICTAESLYPNAANALLKSLEEPGAQTLLILISHQASGVLPTIRSRCQVLDFPVPARQEALAWLQGTLGEDAGRAERLLNVANGAPVAALEMSQSHWVGERSTLVRQWLEVLSGARDPVRTARVEEWGRLPLPELMAWLLAWQIDLMKLMAGVPGQVVNQDLLTELSQARHHINSDRLYAHYLYVQQVVRMLRSSGNPNSQLLLEEMLLKWSQVKA